MLPPNLLPCPEADKKDNWYKFQIYVFNVDINESNVNSVPLVHPA